MRRQARRAHLSHSNGRVQIRRGRPRARSRILDGERTFPPRRGGLQVYKQKAKFLSMWLDLHTSRLLDKWWIKLNPVCGNQSIV